MVKQYADVIIDISHDKVDRPFQYRIPPELAGEVYPGVRVHVPFGKGNLDKAGYVVDISGHTDYPEEKIKSITAVDGKGITAQGSQIQVAYWLKRQYGSTMIAALKTVLPVKQKLKQLEHRKVTRCMEGEALLEALRQCEKKHQTAKARVLQALMTDEVLPYELIRQKLNVAPATLAALEKQGCLKIEAEAYYRNPVKCAPGEEKRVIPSRTQQEIIENVIGDYRAGKPGTYLVHGVTGSGKTEVYLGIIEQMIRMGKQAIMLIPEIALTYQTLLRFYRRFGDRVSVINSSLSQGEKYDQIRRAKARELDVIIGPRSALFTPFPDLGVIIVDEEHESSYKSESMPKYHARETAVQIASMHRASVVLGSATPSTEAYYRAKKGEYKLFEMTGRHGASRLPRVYTIDLREELKQGNRSVFSRKLRELIGRRLQAGEQSMLFLNRRGYAGFVSCRACGHVMKCPHCDISLSQHNNGKMVCHYCGYEEPVPKTCPECGSKYISGFKAGTQKIEEIVKKRFPEARVLRMDFDTTRNKSGYEKILSAFAAKEADILIGTQMIVKGHDFPNVTLVGVLAADLSLYVSDFHAAERTFQLLTQAAGRAGRGKLPGEVVIQTYSPAHYCIQLASQQDYAQFYEAEIQCRSLMGYPPCGHMMVMLVASSDEMTAFLCAELLGQKIRQAQNKGKLSGLALVGPANAPVAKVKDIYKKVIYFKHKEYQELVNIKDVLEAFVAGHREFAAVTIQFDFNPMNGF